jgi:hypothetical protein
MGTLEERTTGRRIALGARCLLGRHQGCDVQAVEPRVSGEHASVHWVASRWELRDLGSRNGTFLEGRRLRSGERATLAEGAAFSLGGPEPAFALVDAAPPGAVARHRGSGALRAAVGGLLVLPDEARPLASVLQDAAGRWMVEIGDEVRPVEDQQELEVEGEVWTLELPRPEDAETWQAEPAGPPLEAIHLRLAVGRDEERVDATVTHGGEETVLPRRSHLYLLVTLARAWLKDAGAPAPKRGWVDRDELCRMLAVDLNRLNVDIHRARKQLASLGIQGAAGVVERRAGTGEIRIGVHRVEVVSS